MSLRSRTAVRENGRSADLQPPENGTSGVPAAVVANGSAPAAAQPQDPAGPAAIGSRVRGYLAGRRTAVAVYAWVQVVLLLWWVGQFPGLISYDSTVYVTHVTLGPWTADHSVLYDFFVLISIELSHGIWLLTLVQTVAWALAVAYFVRSVQMLGVRGRWAALPAIILPFSPTLGGVASTVWKDSAFALTALLLAATMLRLLAVWSVPARRRLRRERASATTPPAGEPPSANATAMVERPPTPWRLLGAILLEFLGLVLFRGDGFVMVFFIVVLAVIVMRGLRVKLLAAAVLALLGMVVANEVVYPAAHIKPASSSLSYGTFYADISVLYRKVPSSFTTADKRLLKKVAPLKHWRQGGNCYSADVLSHTEFNSSKAAVLSHQLAGLWIREAEKHPYLMLKSRLCRGAIGWNPFPPPASRSFTYTLPWQVPSDLFGRATLIPHYIAVNMRPDPLVDGLGTATTWLRVHLTSNVLLVLIWRGATWCYLAYLAIALAAVRRRNWRYLLAGIAPLGNQLMVITDNPAQLFRYMAAALVIGPLLVPLAAVPRRARPEPDAVPARTAQEPEPDRVATA